MPISNRTVTAVEVANTLTMYFTIITSMFDPSLGSALKELAEAMPEIIHGRVEYVSCVSASSATQNTA